MDTLSKSIEIVPYAPELQGQWDEFVTRSAQGTFLHLRGYMEYHADRFADASLMAYRKGKIVAVLPASLDNEGVLGSHPGLTYGGWLLPTAHFDGGDVLDLFDTWIDYSRTHGIMALDYKPVPYIYTPRPAQEDLYALYRHGFGQVSTLLSSSIDLRQPWKFNMSKRQQFRKASELSPIIKESRDFGAFWKILEECLRERHDATPVHSLNEMELLASRFPDNIKLYTLEDNEGLQCGVVVYDTGTVCHAQYTASTPKARKNYLLTALYYRLLTDYCNKASYFDFGTSNERGGTVLNRGLLNQKYSMGGSGVVYSRYRLIL